MTEEQKSTVEVLLANRLYAYSLLYKALAREPDAELLNLLAAESAGEAFALLGEGEDTLSRVPAFFAQLREELDDDFVSEARSEFTRLFIGPIKLVAPAWESMYVGKESMLFSESTLAVRRFYQRYGLQPEGYPRDALHESVDHERPHDLDGREPERLEQPDFGRLLHREDKQRVHHAEHRHDRDEHEQQGHHVLLHGQGVEYPAVRLLPRDDAPVRSDVPDCPRHLFEGRVVRRGGGLHVDRVNPAL